LVTYYSSLTTHHLIIQDRKASGVLAAHSAPISSLYVPYIVPGENGSRTDCSWIQLETAATDEDCPTATTTATATAPIQSQQQQQQQRSNSNAGNNSSDGNNSNNNNNNINNGNNAYEATVGDKKPSLGGTTITKGPDSTGVQLPSTKSDTTAAISLTGLFPTVSEDQDPADRPIPTDSAGELSPPIGRLSATASTSTTAPTVPSATGNNNTVPRGLNANLSLNLNATSTTTSVENTGVSVRISSSKLFQFSAMPFTTEDLSLATHASIMEQHPRSFTSLNIDPFLMGVGGDDSWTASVLDEYLIPPGVYTYDLTFQLFQHS
jgi:hypothetical protein